MSPTPGPTRLRLADRRSLDVWDEGPPDGIVLIAHEGTPGSGMGYEPFARAATERGLRMVSWSRPGYGDSTRLPGRRVADIVEDFAAVLDHLGAERAYVTGHSGGGPHALACAALLPERVIATATIAGVAPYHAEGLDWLAGMGAENLVEFGAALAGEAALRARLEPQRPTILGLSGPDVAAMFGDLVDDVDRGALTGGAYATHLAATMAEGLRVSIDGWLDDDLSFAAPWGFDIGSIPGRVHVWQGAHDRMVPYAHGPWLAAHIPGACPHLLEEHGHLSLAVDGFPAILDELIRP